MITTIVILTAYLAAAALLLIRSQRRLATASRNSGMQTRTIRSLNILNELASALLSSLRERDPMAYVVDMLMDRSKELLRANRSAVILLDRKGSVTGFYTSMGPSLNCKTHLTGILARVHREMVPLRGDTLTEIDGFKGIPKQHPEIRGILVAPIILNDAVIGEVMVSDKANGDRFSAEDEDLLMKVAFYAAAAIEKVGLHDEVKKMAVTDGLTGLNNHRTFQELLRAELERSKRYEKHFSLLMLDIDEFKQFNDSYGHQKGDEVLKAISAVLGESIRTHDVAARYGGEEFAIILTETPLGGAVATAERIRARVEAVKIRTNGDSSGVTISIGVASFPHDGRSPEGLIEAADKALYLSKRSGRNRVHSYREQRAQ